MPVHGVIVATAGLARITGAEWEAIELSLCGSLTATAGAITVFISGWLVVEAWMLDRQFSLRKLIVLVFVAAMGAGVVLLGTELHEYAETQLDLAISRE